MEAGVIRPVRSDWQRTIIVCGKCSKRIGGGFGEKGRTSLAKALRKALGMGKGRKAAVGVVESGCLGLCPKRGIVLVDAATPARWHVVGEGVSVDSVIERLGLPTAGNA